ncbi:MerR family transcriptional regulator [Taibaiella sp. KBW10]|nr:MerR family transcriptional regulator [Taibaiella sp. KBW10]
MHYAAYAGLTFEPSNDKDAEAIPSTEAVLETDEESVSEEENIVEEAVAASSNAPLVPLPEFNLEDKYYSIGEVAAMFGVNVSHIRFWTTEFSLKVRTTRKGDRLFNPANIAKLRLIHHLVKEQRHTIKGAKEKLKHSKQAINAQVDLKDKLSFLKEKLERIKRNL